MQQSNFIFGILLVAYIAFIVTKGELGAYLALFKGAGTPATASTSGSASGLFGQLTNLFSGASSTGPNVFSNAGTSAGFSNGGSLFGES